MDCAEALVPKPRPAENAAARIKPRTLKPRYDFHDESPFECSKKPGLQAVKKQCSEGAELG